MTTDNSSVPVWQPRDVSNTNVWKFMVYINRRYNLSLRSYEDLHQWSVAGDSLQTFWKEAYDWLQLAPRGSGEAGPMLKSKRTEAVDMFPPPTFFPSESLNITELMLRDRKNDSVAIYFARDGLDGIEDVTWGAFTDRIRSVQSAMLSSGIVQGDVIAAVISNSVDAMIICLAALSLGAVWSSSSCDLGTAGIVDRYKQINPKIVFADNGYIYAEKTIGLQDRIIDWSHKLGHECEALEMVVVLDYANTPVDLSKVHKGCDMESFLKRDSGTELQFNIVPFSHPAFILYSSGTTGIPKCIVHSSGGVALKVKTDMALQHDVRRSDVVFQYTTTSWVMWVLNLLSLSCAGSMLLYDGSPFHPRPTILLELAQKTGVSVFGTSPRYLAELKSQRIVPRDHFDLSKLRVMTSTGSTLSAELYDWFYATAFPSQAQLISMSGGTDISGCFLGGSPMLPIFAGEIQCKALGMAVEIFDANRQTGTTVYEPGEAGELVCTKPFPSQPLAFIGNQGAQRYEASYFERFGRGVWCQGDFVKEQTGTGGLVMLGRSDGVLNPSGVRFGSAEIYAVTETFVEIADSICVGQRRDIDDDERVLLFVKMRPGCALDLGLRKRISTAIKGRYSPRHVPKLTFAIDDIPYTVNGKKCEINVKNVVNNRKGVISGTVANPTALKLYEKYAGLPAEKHTTRAKTSKL